MVALEVFGIFLIWLSPSSNKDLLRLLSMSEDTGDFEIPRLTVVFYLYKWGEIDLKII